MASWRGSPVASVGGWLQPGPRSSTAGEGAFAAKIRTRWYRVGISLYQLPGLAPVNHAAKSSELGGFGSPRRGKIRTILPVAIVASQRVANGPNPPQLAYHFPGTPRPALSAAVADDESPGQHRNPVAVAREWQAALARSTRAELARSVGVSRARVSQVLRLLDLAPGVLDAVEALGDPLGQPGISERRLRLLFGMSPDEQEYALSSLLDAAGRP